MRIQDYVIRISRTAVENLFRNARGTLPEKLTWKPESLGRSVLEQVQEVAQAVGWFIAILQQKKMPESAPEMVVQARKESESWKTIDACENACIANSEKLYEVINVFPDKDLDIPIHLPFWRAGKGFDATMADVLLFHYWNVVYHQGQINYIQTLYGDKDMH